MKGHDTAFPLCFDSKTLEEIGRGFNENGKTLEVGGLTKREYFAAMAMQGLCALPDDPKNPVSIQGLAMNSVRIADALIEALNKQSK